MKAERVDIATAMQHLKCYLETHNLQNTAKMKELHKSNEVTTEDEMKLVLTLANNLGSMGYEIDSTVCLGILNAVLKILLPSTNYCSVTSSVVERMLAKNSDDIKLVHGNTIDPVRIRQADVEVRDAYFYKIESYITLLKKMGKIPWKTYNDISKRNLYNADGCTTNTYEHRKKTIGDAAEFGRAFQITPGGDGRMPFHVTSIITSCASVNYKVPIECIGGAPPPMIIHA